VQKLISFILAILALFGFKEKDYKKCASFSVISECRYLQGACTDGEYIYQAFSHQVNSEKKGNYIFKIDAKTYKVKEKVALTAGHMNDMTYNSKTGMIVSAQSGGTGSKAYMLTFIDTQTLTVQSEKNIGRNVSTIAYDAERDCYYACTYDPKLLTLDSDCKIISEVDLDFNGYTRQGTCFRDGILYFLLYGESGNCICRYSAEGTLLGDYKLDIPTGEPEGIFFIGENLYVTYSGDDYKQGIIYRIKGLG